MVGFYALPKWYLVPLFMNAADRTSIISSNLNIIDSLLVHNERDDAGTPESIARCAGRLHRVAELEEENRRMGYGW